MTNITTSKKFQQQAALFKKYMENGDKGSATYVAEWLATDLYPGRKFIDKYHACREDLREYTGY